jgi:small GTP-binding protein
MTQLVPTIGVGNFLGEFPQGDSGCIFDLWDTSGQEAFHSLTQSYTRRARGAILVFDVTDHDSLDALAKWRDILRDTSPRAQIVIFGNKTDEAAKREVSTEEANRFAEETGGLLIEGSVKTGQNVRSVFVAMAKFVTLAPPDPAENLCVEISDTGAHQSNEVDGKNTEPKKKGCC